MECYGIRGRVNDLFRSYLSNRKQYVEANNKRSALSSLTRGVTQGSCLGPVTYLIYTNDMSRLQLHGKLHKFADDGDMLYKSTSHALNCAHAEEDLNLVSRYFCDNGMRLNLKKTTCIHFRSRRSQQNLSGTIVCQGQEIKRVSSSKYLGVYLDEHMKMDI